MTTLKRLLACALPALLIVGQAFAQDEAPQPAQVQSGARSEDALDSAIVWIDDQPLFRVPGVSTYSAEDRARRIGARIAAAAADRTIPKESVRVVETETGTQIVAGEHPLVIVREADAALEGSSVPRLAAAYATRIQQGIEVFRSEREPRRLIRSGLYALFVTLVLVFVLWPLRLVRKRVQARFAERLHARVASVSIRSVELIERERIWGIVRGMTRGAYLLLIASIIFAYLQVVLQLFPWTRGIATGFLGYLADPLRHIVLAALGFVPNLLFLAVLFVVTRFVLKAIHLFASSIESGAVTLTGFDPEWTWPTYKLVRVAVIAFAVIVAYPYIPGSQSLAFKGVSLFVGVLFSLGSSSVISNVLAGYTMTYRRAFKIGDRIEVDSSIGEVVETRLLVTHLRTAKNEEVILPNSLILNGKVINYSSIAKRQGLILHTTVGIGYETPWRQVEAMLLAAAAAASERLPSLLKDPKPFVLQRALGDFCITYEINVYTDAPGAMFAGYAELHRNILDVFNEYGVQIMTPAYEGDPEQAKLVPKDQWYTAPAPPPQGGTPGPDRKR